MIIRPRRQIRGSLWSRWFGQKTTRHTSTLGESEFDLAVVKERARCDRRNRDRTFVLIFLSTPEQGAFEKKQVALCQQLRTRLRITDEIGWRNNQLCLLLPETDRVGGQKVAEEIGETCFELDLKLETEIWVYPDDDEIASKSFEVDGEHRHSDHPGGMESNDGSLTQPPLHRDKERSQQTAKQPDASKETTGPISCSIPTPIWKRLFDMLGAFVAMTLLLPVYLLVAVAIKLDSPGPVFFRQRREGKDGREFDIFKFRTMRTGAHEEQDRLRELKANEQDGPAFKLTNDPRVTRIGRYLRKTCVDELPQMFNVLIGDMSLVGPRPLPVDESYGSKRWHRRRLEVLPGLTCIWQVQGRRDIEFDEWMRMDLEYIQRRSLSLDLKLLFQTLLVVILHRGSV